MTAGDLTGRIETLQKSGFTSFAFVRER